MGKNKFSLKYSFISSPFLDLHNTQATLHRGSQIQLHCPLGTPAQPSSQLLGHSSDPTEVYSPLAATLASSSLVSRLPKDCL